MVCVGDGFLGCGVNFANRLTKGKRAGSFSGYIKGGGNFLPFGERGGAEDGTDGVVRKLCTKKICQYCPTSDDTSI